ncbi:FAD-linked oxidase C-terminal domain-containing protein [Nocardia crassostreae]|uniref:FAD-linked oxidase C-terminal domain-containing protein n=1 Tax=Nocardia crassostreae TaxID=53428 RepID=UPI000A8E4F79|nr:FAD-linked oxidase C-terminal domain-containing protein [Nocardia crassostreae]
MPLLPERAAAWLMFDTVDDAATTVPKFMAAGAQVAELLDGETLRSISVLPEGKPAWSEVSDKAAALLVEVRAADSAALAAALPALEAVLADCPLTEPGRFTRDKAEMNGCWEIREGLGGLLGLQRPVGHNMISEDVCVPPNRVAEAVADVNDLLAKHGYHPSVQGHASAGNLHFCPMVDFGSAAGTAEYAAFMDDLVDLIIGKYDGSLKAEHATGRKIAPFLPIEWGPRATDLMWRIKAAFDPGGLLAPDVVLTRDPQLHLKNLQSMPHAEDTVEHCIECGFCEHVCPSRHLTVTPRQRIVLRREMIRQGGDTPIRRALLDEYEYEAVETCAGDGSCAIACPVDIDTGTLMKTYRHSEHSSRTEKIALLFARRWALVERIARTAVRLGHLAGSRVTTAITGLLRRVISTELLPAWLPQMPPAAKAALPQTDRATAVAVYFPACINRIFGRATGGEPGPSLPEALVAVSARAGLPV